MGLAAIELVERDGIGGALATDWRAWQTKWIFGAIESWLVGGPVNQEDWSETVWCPGQLYIFFTWFDCD